MHPVRAAATAVLVFAAVGVPVACGGASQDGAKASLAVSTDAGAPPVASSEPGRSAAAASPTTAPIASIYTTDPNALANLLAAAAAAGTAMLTPAGAALDPAELGLRAAAAQYAPGMSPEGPVAKGNLAEGGHVGFIANLDPSKCYAIVAFGAGLADLDVNLLAPPLYSLLAGQDGMAGPTAVIGAAPRAMCPVFPISVPYKVDLFAKKGGGPVAAQVYAKPR